ncbi:MotA/TolQ/ExbB proton channel family protein [Thiocystis violacea]|uniref:MotA/TolQ/ExbB proton channel family protein n=1 Tax=Thiocystis violacea TaxID=13725 RepID=UPI001906A0C6|nr:MotA/TolQ/ExbB proton channel family protein [Thiocystis violacea]MBK1720755.1 hypothetical protein [Thiocystis violacea]
MRGIRILPLLLCLSGPFASAAPEVPTTPDALLRRLTQERAEAAVANAARERRFVEEKAQQAARLDEIRKRLATERKRGQDLQAAVASNQARIGELESQRDARAGGLTELFGVARQAAGDGAALLRDSLVSSQLPGRVEPLAALARSERVPNIAELEGLWLALHREMTESGKVVTYGATVTGADGGEHAARVTRIGGFDAVSGGRFLRYLPETGTLAELPRQPAAHFGRRAAELEAATSGMAPLVVDPTGGAVLSLLTQVPDLLERVQQGRLVGYIIIGLALVGALLALERFVLLAVLGRRMRRELRQDPAAQGEAKPIKDNPLGRVLAVYRDHPGVDTETLELMIDERILKDTPRLQRGLPTLKLLAMIAPLLGLLGTVTGLIETFQAITLYGAGDPRLMAGGISQALVTTVLGLIVAIPLILIHSGLLGQSRRLVAILEEQSAGLVARHAERRGGHASAG